MTYANSMANFPRVMTCASDESAAEDDVAKSMDNVRVRSTGGSGCTGSVPAKSEDDVDGRRNVELDNCLPGNADCTGVWILRVLGGNEESWACAAS
jgi:hypothetical protein